MEPVKSNSLSKACSEVSSSSCTVYDGPDIECISLCKGATVTDVMYRMAQKLCSIPAPTSIDLSALNLACLQKCCPVGYTVNIDGFCTSVAPPYTNIGKASNCADCPTCQQPTFEKTLVNILQLMINKQCTCCP